MTTALREWGAAPASELTTLQKTALSHLQTLGFPGPKNDLWKYIDLDQILDRSFSSALPDDFSGLGHCFSHAYRIVIVNGVVKQEEVAQLGVTIRSVSANSHAIIETETPDANPFVHLNMAQANDQLQISLSENVVLDKPLHILIVTRGSDEAVMHHPQVVFHLAEGARASAVLTHHNNGAHFANLLCQVRLDKGARLDLVDANHEAGDGVRFDTLRASIAADAVWNATFFSSGSALTRLDVVADFWGENAQCHLNGLGMLTGEAQVFSRTLINHHVPNCEANQLFKTVLGGKAQSEYNGLVYVVKDAIGSDSSQSNQNLLLSDQARALSRPQLRIHADDVKAAHGATVGQLDETSIFYLKSRGLSEAEARSLLMVGFADDVIDHIEMPMVRDYLHGLVAPELKRLAVT